MHTELEQRLKTAESTIDSMSKRLRLLEDVEEIKQIQRNYIKCLQQAKYDTIEDFFAENATFPAHITFKGKAAIGKMMREQLSALHKGQEGIILTHPIITIEGDKAKGSWILYFMYSHPKTWQSLFWVQGFYDTKYIKEKGQWKINCMQFKQRLAPPSVKNNPPDDYLLEHFLDRI